MSKYHKWQLISVARVWFQSFLTIEVAMHIKDLISRDFFWQGCLAAFVPVIIRWATPQDEFPNERQK